MAEIKPEPEKGKPGRRLGSKNKVLTLRDLAVRHNRRAVTELARLMRDAEDETVRLKAATQLTVLAEGLPGRRTAPPEPDEGAAKLTPEQIAAMMGDS